MPIITRLTDGQVGIVERSGRYFKTIFPGPIHFIIPVIDELFLYELKPKTFKLPKISLLVKGSFTIDVELTMKYKIMEPWKARYEVENKDLEFTIERFIIKSLSAQVNEKSLEEAVSMQAELTELLKKQLNNVSKNWGFKLFYIEILSMKKSFLAEQEKEKLYDMHKEERGTYMSEKVDLRDPSKAVHLTDQDEETDIIDFTSMTSQLQDVTQNVQHNVSEQIEVLEDQMQEIEDEDLREMSQYQIDIFKQHQDDMLKLQEKDLKKQHDDLMYQIQEMSKLQKELIEKQNALIQKQQQLDEKKQQIQKTSEHDLSKLEEDNYKLKKLATTDPLTGLYNRRYFEKEVSKKLIHANEHQTCITLLMIDIDHFKQTNDTYGHLAGDEALKVVSSIIKGYFKNYGLCCRYGGEEFAIALLEACYDKAHEYAEKLRILVEEANISFGGQIIPLTISIGLAIKDEQETIKKEDLILRADKALYRAKHNGRNQTVLYKELEE